MQQLKEQRLTPAKKFVLEIIKGVKPSEDWDGTISWFDENGWILFLQDFNNNWLKICSFRIVKALEVEYNLNNNEIIKLLTKILHKYTNNGELKIFFF